MKNQPTLIEYAAFFGSIQILNYLNTNNIELTSSLWPYAIHSFNQELIFLLLEKKVKPLSESFVKCSLDAIKCHNNELFEYIQNNLVNDAEKNNEEIVSKCIKCYNFAILDHHLLFIKMKLEKIR